MQQPCALFWGGCKLEKVGLVSLSKSIVFFVILLKSKAGAVAARGCRSFLALRIGRCIQPSEGAFVGGVQVYLKKK